MKKALTAIFVLQGFAWMHVCHAQTLVTAPSNNGSGGVFMTFQPNGQSLDIISFDVPFNTVSPVTASIEVWMRSGPYAGFTGSSVGWTLTQTATATSQGPDVPVAMALNSPIHLPVGAPTTSVYLHSITSGAGIRYSGTTDVTPQTSWGNADLFLFSDTGRTGVVPFSGSVNSPRAFSGSIHYEKVFETAPSNNSSGGVFLNLTPVSQPLQVTGFAVPLAASPGTLTTVQVWRRQGSYVGFTDSNAGWTLTQSVSATAQGELVPAYFRLTTPISLAPSQFNAIYLHAVHPAATASGIRYTGTSGTPPQTAWANADLLLFSDTARIGFVAFGGSQNSPRTFSGRISYQAIHLFENGFEN